jgi:hypothetical protein
MLNAVVYKQQDIVNKQRGKDQAVATNTTKYRSQQRHKLYNRLR